MGREPPFRVVREIARLRPGISTANVGGISIGRPCFTNRFPSAPVVPKMLLVRSTTRLYDLMFTPRDIRRSGLCILLGIGSFGVLHPIVPNSALVVDMGIAVSAGSTFRFTYIVGISNRIETGKDLLFAAVSGGTICGPSRR